MAAALCFRAVENPRVRGWSRTAGSSNQSALAPEESIKSINCSPEILTCQGSMILVEWLGSLGVANKCGPPFKFWQGRLDATSAVP